MLLKKEKCKKKWLQYIKLKTSEELEQMVTNRYHKLFLKRLNYL